MPDGNDSTTGKPGSRLRELGLVLPKARTTAGLPERPAAPKCASRTLSASAPNPCGGRILTSGTTFVTLRSCKRTLSALDSGPPPRRAKSNFLSVGIDNVISAFPECGISWKQENKKLKPLVDLMRRQYKDPSGSAGFGMRHASFQNPFQEIMSGKVGLYEVNSHLAAVEIRTEQDYKVFSCLIGQKAFKRASSSRSPRDLI